jgi:hypothetical protein
MNTDPTYGELVEVEGYIYDARFKEPDIGNKGRR